MGIHHIRSEDVQPDEMFLTGKTHFYFTIT